MKIKEKLHALEKNPTWGSMIQFVKFGIVGVSNTLIALGVYWLCFYLLHMHYQLSNFISFIVSVTNAYYWNSKYVFKNGVKKTAKKHIRAYGKAFLSYGGTYLLSVALLYLWVEKLNISEGIAPLINLLVTIPLNFMLNKFWAFRT
jgi:putative flippase GtrA